MTDLMERSRRKYYECCRGTKDLYQAQATSRKPEPGPDLGRSWQMKTGGYGMGKPGQTAKAGRQAGRKLCRKRN